MGTIVVAQIGKTKYTETTYKRAPEETGVKSKYAFEAVLKEALADNPDKVDLILLVTKDSCFGTVYEDFGKDINMDLTLDSALLTKVYNKFGTEVGKTVSNIYDLKVRSQYEADLSQKLKEHFSSESEISVTVAIIDQGQAGEELPSNFEVIRKTVEGVMQADGSDDNWDIYFDITNGFRSFPIYIYTLTNYLSRIWSNQTTCYIYYGMFDVSEDLGYTPLVNLQVVDDLLQLINAVSEFQNCGSVKQILEILEKHPEWDIPIGINEKETLSYAFKMFDYGTNSNNLAAIERGINLLTNVEKPMNDAEKLLLTSISEDFKKRFGTEESRSNKPYQYSFLLIQLADWFHEMGREGNAAIAVQETVITYLMERYSVQMTKYLLGKKDIWKLSSDNSDKPNFREGCDLKETQFLFAHELRDEIKSLFNGLRTEDKDGEFTRFYKNYQNIQKNIRNVMAHIVLTEGSENDYQNYTDTLKDQIEILSEEIKNAKDSKEYAGLGNVMIDLMFPKASQELWKKLWNPIKELEEDDSIQVNYNRLIEQMNCMEKITKSDSDEEKTYKIFKEEQGQLDLVFKGMDSWIHKEEGNDVNPEKYYPKYYGEKLNRKGELQTGYERLKKTIENDYKIFNAILTF